MKYLIIIICLLISYLYGSIPFALVIGKVFYNTDVRQYGSHNPTNRMDCESIWYFS